MCRAGAVEVRRGRRIAILCGPGTCACGTPTPVRSAVHTCSRPTIPLLFDIFLQTFCFEPTGFFSALVHVPPSHAHWAFQPSPLRISTHFSLPYNPIPRQNTTRRFATCLLNRKPRPASDSSCVSLLRRSSLFHYLFRGFHLVPPPPRRSQARSSHFLRPSCPRTPHPRQRQQSGIPDRRHPSRRRRSLHSLAFSPLQRQPLLVRLPPRKRPHPDVIRACRFRDLISLRA